MAIFEPAMLDDAGLKEVQLAQLKELKAAQARAGTKDIRFVAAAGIRLKDGQKVGLFVALPKPEDAKAWLAALKAKKPAVLAEGTCAFAKSKDGKATQVLLKKITGKRREDVTKMVTMALGKGQPFQVRDAMAKGESAGSASRRAEAGDLGWVTPEQAKQAADIYGHTWPKDLTEVLAQRWGTGWTSHSDNDLRKQLDALLPMLTLPFADAELSREEAKAVDGLIEEVQTEALDRLADQIPDLARELGLTEAEVAQVIAEIPADKFAEALVAELPLR